jgi:hypothetical protein
LLVEIDAARDIDSVQRELEEMKALYNHGG